MYRDKEGNEISDARWMELWRDTAYRQVELTEVGPFQVSTVWIGIVHPWFRSTFETMTFEPDGEGYGLGIGPCYRTCTIEEARAAHARAVQEARQTLIRA